MRILPAAGIVARPGDTVSIQVTLGTIEGLPGEELPVAVEGLPQGITIEPPVARLGTSATMSVVIAPSVAPTQQPIECVLRAGPRFGESAVLRITIVSVLEPGMLDPHFGFGGLVPLPQYMDPFQLVLDSENRLVVAGAPFDGFDAVLARFHADGRADETFGDAGAQVIAAVPDRRIVPRALYSDASGELRLMTEAHVDDFDTRARVFRRAGDGGSIDEVVLDGFFTDWNDVGIDGQGRFIVVGQATQPAVARFSAGGQLDTTFGDNGLVRDWPTTILDGWNDLTMAGDDAYVLGSSCLSPCDGPSVAHISPDGVQQKLQIGDAHEICCIDLDSRGRIVVAGGSLSAMRVLDTLAIDSTFGTPWARVPDAEASYTGAMLLLADDSVMLAGARVDLEGLLLVHLGADGRPIPIGAEQRAWLTQLADARAMVRLPEGDLILAGREVGGYGVLARIIAP